MNRRKYKSYLQKDSLFGIKKTIPRQTRFSIIKKFQGEFCRLSPQQPLPVTHFGENNSTSSLEFSAQFNYESGETYPDVSESSSDASGDESSEVASDTESSIGEPNLPDVESDSLIHQNLTVKEGSLLIFAFILRHRLSNEGVQHLLDLIRLFCPGSNFPGSKFLLKKQLSVNYKSLNYHYYCPSCNHMIKYEDKSCPKCKEVNGNNYFITFDVRESFANILQQKEVTTNLLQNLRARNKNKNEVKSYYQEIYDGEEYQNLRLNPLDFTATMNNDGVPCFRSSKFSISPFLLSINELSYTLRKKHTFVAALWFGKTKPSMQSFLPPIVEMFNKFSAEGIKWQSNDEIIISHVYFPILAADSVARCSLQGINQFNGCYGCPWCLEKGETFWRNEKCHKWVYKSHNAELRNQTQFFSDLKTFRDKIKITPSTKHFRGIQNASGLLLLNQFNIVSGFVFDYMHTMELGVSRTLTNAWLDPQHREKAFYVGNKMKILNDRINSWRMPMTSDRTIRTLEERKHWKSSEWRIWTFLSPVILKDVLPNPYYLHFLKYVRSLFQLCGKKVYTIDIPGIRATLKDFVESVENLYGSEFCSFNMHLLVHATKCVEDWGPLWNYSLFHFESFNGILLKYFKASYKIEAQISNKIIENSYVLTLGSKIFSNSATLYFYEELIEKCKVLEKSKVDSTGCVVLGASKPYFLNLEELDLIMKLGDTDQVISCDSFKRGFFSNIHVGVEANITKKRCKCVVKLGSNILIVKSIIFVTFSTGTRICYLVSTKLKTTQFVRSYSAAFNTCNNHKIIICRASSIEDCCYYVSLTSANSVQQIVLLPNSIETE